MNVKLRPWLAIAGLLGATGVALGAVAAHAVSDPQAVSALERATTYQILHAIALAALAGYSLRLLGFARLLMCLGTLVFCGAIYAKYLFGIPDLGKFAPAGGTALILSWLLVTIAAALHPSSEKNSAD
jgi:uncharacterized membrane protein YgdD (TMEM256/DUF423 family)